MGTKPEASFIRSRGWPQETPTEQRSSCDSVSNLEAAGPSNPLNQDVTWYRQLEMLNIFIGFEQTNKYVICRYHILIFLPGQQLIEIANEADEVLGFIAEEPRGFLASFSRQILRTHRPFRAVIMDREGTPVLWV